MHRHTYRHFFGNTLLCLLLISCIGDKSTDAPRMDSLDESTIVTSDQGVPTLDVAHHDASEGEASPDGALNIRDDRGIQVCTSTPEGPVPIAAGPQVCEEDYPYLAQVNGVVVDERGACVGDALADLWIGNTAHTRPVALDPSGRFTITLPEGLTCLGPALLTVRRSSPSWQRAYCGIEEIRGDAVVDLQVPMVLPNAKAALTSSAVPGPIRFPDGLWVLPGDTPLTPLHDGALRATPVEPNQSCVFQGVDNPTHAYAFTPESRTTVNDSIQLHIPNTEAAQPGQQYAVWIQGTEMCAQYNDASLHLGEWVRVDTATVNDSGLMIVTDGGVNCLGWLALTRLEQ